MDFFARNVDLTKGKSNSAQYQAVETKPTEWTDEKHTLYLKTMETLFVDQLYQSLDLEIERNHQVDGSTTPKHRNQQHKLMQSESDGEFSTSNAKSSPPFPQLFDFPQAKHRLQNENIIHGYPEMMDQNF